MNRLIYGKKYTLDINFYRKNYGLHHLNDEQIIEHFHGKGLNMKRVGCKKHFEDMKQKNLSILEKSIEKIQKDADELHTYNDTVNVIIRTSNRPKMFDKCINSVLNQTHENIKIIVSVDNEFSKDYVKKYIDRVHMVKMERNPDIMYWFNDYINIMFDYTDDGWIIILDDDNVFTSNLCIQKLLNCVYKRDKFLFSRRPSDYSIPVSKDNSFYRFRYNRNDRMINHDTSSILFHTVLLKYKPRMGVRKGGDYNLIKCLRENTEYELVSGLVFTSVNYTDHVCGCGGDFNE